VGAGGGMPQRPLVAPTFNALLANSSAYVIKNARLRTLGSHWLIANLGMVNRKYQTSYRTIWLADLSYWPSELRKSCNKDTSLRVSLKAALNCGSTYILILSVNQMQALQFLRLLTLSIWILQGADPDGEDPEGNKLMDTVKDEAIKSMLKNV